MGIPLKLPPQHPNLLFCLPQDYPHRPLLYYTTSIQTIFHNFTKVNMHFFFTIFSIKAIIIRSKNKGEGSLPLHWRSLHQETCPSSFPNQSKHASPKTLSISFSQFLSLPITKNSSTTPKKNKAILLWLLQLAL